MSRFVAPSGTPAPISALEPIAPPPSSPALARKPARVSPAASAAVSRIAPSASISSRVRISLLIISPSP